MFFFSYFWSYLMFKLLKMILSMFLRIWNARVKSGPVVIIAKVQLSNMGQKLALKLIGL